MSTKIDPSTTDQPSKKVWDYSPEDHQVTQLILEDGKYLERICIDEITMHVPPNTNVDLRKVW